MNILLIHPNLFAQRYVSMGLAMISAALKDAGHRVSFLDTSRFGASESVGESNETDASIEKMTEVLQFKPVALPSIERSTEPFIEAIKKRIESFKPQLIGLSATSSEMGPAAEIARAIKPYGVPLIIGGAHPTVAPTETLALEGVDMVCRGEGEEAIVELVEAIAVGGYRTDIANIWFDRGGRVVTNDVRPYICDLDRLPFPDLGIFDDYHFLGAYQGQVVSYGRFESARGCPFKCTYCINSNLHQLYSREKRHVRHKSPGRFIAEMEYSLDETGFDIVRMLDETFLASTEQWLEEFVALYRQRIGKPLVVTTRPETVKRGKMELLRQAHEDIQITMGIESGSERIRKQVCNRRHSNQDIIDAYHLCHELNFFTSSFNMIGLPGETRRDFMDTIEVNRAAGVMQPMLSYFYPFPGTPLRDVCLAEGYVDDEIHQVDYSVTSKLHMPQFPLEEIEGLKRTFVMYVKMKRDYFPEIEKAERDNEVFSRLAAIYNRENPV